MTWSVFGVMGKRFHQRSFCKKVPNICLTNLKKCANLLLKIVTGFLSKL